MKSSRALIMIVTSIVLALVAVVFAARWISKQANMATAKVAVAAVDINVGARIAPEMVRFADWPTGSKPKGSFTDIKELQERVTRTNILAGEPLLEARLAPIGAKGGLSAVVAEGKRAMTVRVNDVIGVAGFALPGNYVDILVSTQDEAKREAGKDSNISKLVLERILVLAVAQEASQTDIKPKVVNAVTLEVTPEQAEKLDLARSVGQLSLVLRNQIDLTPAQTGGATKQSLLYEPAREERKPTVTKVVAVRKPKAPTPAPAEENCQLVMTPNGRIVQCFK
ncbi:Flp pilus assembly protein CpaB [Noviherbaspirillum denitrificans]|uniref:Flp pilus assembly protein CpaB n=1 Tax=Noviherbaspirillum denitrificans TaxID=1968433 RepID=A0A254TJ27_9BURK|nr:Flp pilus assembly protein CpaB [Noviherbaspirillum denitrificans]OWW20573.1 Flp pilus assembly protein CpaB [Noviherbaspirillum denitrificans]